MFTSSGCREIPQEVPDALHPNTQRCRVSADAGIVRSVGGAAGSEGDAAESKVMHKPMPRRPMLRRRPDDLYNGYMPRRMTATEVKAKILALLDEAAAGDEVEITKHGRTVARLVPATGPHTLEGSLTGVAMSAAEDEDLFTTGEAWELA
jgi:prevent-host-death family protein